MSAARLLGTILLLAMGAAHAQDAGEIAFWESVRESKDPVELRAYLERYPNGAFSPLATARLARFGGEKPRPAAAPRAPASSSMASKSRAPLVGDTWSYRLTYPRLRMQWQDSLLKRRVPADHVVTVSAIDGGKIVDRLSIDGGVPNESSHPASAYLALQGVSIFSPYLLAFRDASSIASLRGIENLDSACEKNYRCEAKVSKVSNEVLNVPAGRFETVKVTIVQEWRPFSSYSTTGSSAADMVGGRTLTVWYSQEMRRAVKYTSRLVAGLLPPMESNFDLELVEYQLK